MGEGAPRLLVYRLGSIGDTMVAMPCFHAVARHFPGHRRILLSTRPRHAEVSPEALLAPTGLIHEFIDYDPGLRSPGELLRLARRVRALGAERLIYLAATHGRHHAHTWRDLAFFRLACGLRHVDGVPLTEDLQRNRRDPATGEEEPEYLRLARCTAAAGLEVEAESAASWRLHLGDDEITAARTRLAPVLAGGRACLVVSPGAKIPVKDWGSANWAAWAEAFSARHPDVSAVLVGGPGDREVASRVAATWSGRCLNLSGATTIRETAAVIERCDVFVGHDSGPMHLAAAAGLPCVALFGGWSYSPPGRWYPWGTGHAVIHKAPLKDISVAEVVAATERLLIRRGSGT